MDDLELPEDKINRLLKEDKITYEEAEKQLRNIIQSLQKGKRVRR